MNTTKAPVHYRDSTVGRVRVSRKTAAKIVRDWRKHGHRPAYRGGRTPRDAFYGPDSDHYIERDSIRGANRRPTAKAHKARARKPRAKVVTTTTRSNIKTIRRSANPRLVVLYATKPGHKRLRYVGRGKFGETGRAKLFTDAAAAAAAQMLRDLYPQVLRGWTLSAGAAAAAPKSGARRAPRRRLAQGVDPAEAIYRDKVRRDSEAAHRWLAKQAK
jgi:hypothetical protein